MASAVSISAGRTWPSLARRLAIDRVDWVGNSWSPRASNLVSASAT
ncbi:hypothetical protein [Marivita sp.]|nr:hypothetical protein [Marivita sp.]